MENPISGLKGHHIVATVVTTLVVIAIIKFVATTYPSIPVFPQIAPYV